MIKQLYVHIGDHKTGSTSIQTALAHSGLKTGTKTLIYPAKRNHNGLAFWFKKPELRNQISDRLTNLNQTFLTSQADIGVISAESFEGCTPEQLDEMLKEHFPEFAQSACLIAYVRPHAQRILSSFAEQTKIGVFSGSLSGFHQKALVQKRFIYTPRFARWREVFGDRIIIKPMVRSLLVEQDVTRDFLTEILGSECDFTLPPPSGANTSLSLEELSVLRLFHKRLGADARGVRHSIGWLLQTILSALPADHDKRTKVALDETLAQDILAAYEQDAKDMDAAFFAQSAMYESLIKDVATTVAEPQSILARDHFPPDTLRRLKAVARTVATMASYDPDQMRAHLRDKTTDAFLATDTKRAKITRRSHQSKQPSDPLIDILDIFQ